MKALHVLLIVIIVAMFLPLPAKAGTHLPSQALTTSGVSCGRPESDAVDIFIMNNADYPPGTRYYWDHANLTIAVLTDPNVEERYVAAIRRAFAEWSTVFADCFGGVISLTDVTGTQPSEHKAADIVVHFVPHGFVNVSGMANCGPHSCPNVWVHTEWPKGIFVWGEASPEYLYAVTLHEVGHTLGIGHPTNLYDSTDLMGYGWNDDVFMGRRDTPLISDCDVDALAFAWAWALEGGQPHPPAEGPYLCSLD